MSKKLERRGMEYTYPYGVARSVEKKLDTNLGVMDDSNLTEKVA